MARRSRRRSTDEGHRWLVLAVAALFLVSPLAGVAGAVPAAGADGTTAAADDRGATAGGSTGGGTATPGANKTVRNETGYLAGRGKYDLYNVSPRSDVGKIVVVATSPPSSDFDLYATVDGRLPTPSDHDFRSYTTGAVEKMVISGRAARAAGSLELAIRSYNGSSRYALRVIQYERSSGNATNRKPIAALTYRCVASKCVFKSSGRDVDGHVSEYALDTDPSSAGPTHRFTSARKTVTASFSPGGIRGATHPVSLTVTDDDGGTRSVTNDVSVYPPYPAVKAEASPTPKKAREKLEDGSDTLGKVDPDGGHPLSNVQDSDPTNAVELRESYLGTPGCSGFFGCIIDAIVNHLFGDGDYFYGMQVAVGHGVPAGELTSDPAVQKVQFQLTYRMGNDPEPIDVAIYNARKEKLASATLDPTTSKTDLTFEIDPDKLTDEILVVYSDEVQDEGENDQTELFVYSHHFVVTTGNTTSTP